MKIRLIASVFLVAAGFTQFAEAAVTITFTQSGSDVILSATGTLDLTGATKATQAVSLGATHEVTSGGRITIGSGSDAPVDLFYLTRINKSDVAPLAITTGSFTSWSSTFTDSSAGNATVGLNSIRFAQDTTGTGTSTALTNRVFVDDAVEVGDTLNINGSATYANKTLADFGLTAGYNILWLQNTAVAGEAGKIYITAVPEPSTIGVLSLGLAGLLIRRRRP